MNNLEDEQLLQNLLAEAWKDNHDPTHDMDHVQRVVRTAKYIAVNEGGQMDVILPAAWLHDCVNLPKNHPDRKMASRYAADHAVKLLRSLGTSEDTLQRIWHAIEAHSFSAGIEPQTLEAKIVQDADRMDSLGAIGLARTFAVSGMLGRTLWDSADPLAESRVADDGIYGLDHLYVKLFGIAETLHTDTARKIAGERVDFMKRFADQIKSEVKFGMTNH